jgi:hypothetical protein
MHTLANGLVVLVGVGLLTAAAPPLSFSPPSSNEQGPSLGNEALPSPRALPTGPPREELAPAPREQTTFPNNEGTLGQAHEELAPLPHTTVPGPPRLAIPSYIRSAPPIEVQALRRELEGLRMEREAMLNEQLSLLTARSIHGDGDESARLRRRITELLTKAAVRTKNRSTPTAKSNTDKTTPQTPQTPQTTRNPPSLPAAPATRPAQPTPPAQSAKTPDRAAKTLTDAPVDPLALARSLFQVGDTAAALTKYRKLEREEQKTEDRITIQYMMACCLRKLGKIEEASVLYREVGNSGGNEVLVENAQWYLKAMKERRELESQFDEIHQRRKALTPRKP